MNKLYKITLGVFISALVLQANAQSSKQQEGPDKTNMREGENIEYCLQHKKMMEMLKDPVKLKIYQAEQADFEKKYQAALNTRQTTQYTVDTIPIVFHVLHNGGPEKISREQIMDALDILNRDFAKRNADTANVLSTFQPIISRPNIHFGLATKAPNGQCFSGITYTNSPLTYDGSNGYAQVNAIKQGNDVYNGEWPGDEYLNIFVCADIGDAAGYTYNPMSGFTQMSNGIWVLNTYVGSIGTSSISHSRTLTHESGHWLNLSHTWGSTNSPGQGTCGSDNVSDTPTTQGVTSCNLSENYCGPLANVENYMDYSYCSKMFTEGQATRMRTALYNGTANRDNLTTNQNKINTGVRDYSFCKADFEAGNIIVCEGQTLQFTDMSYHNTTNWNWTFTGGTPSSSSDQNPTVTYSTAGTYTVTLTAGDGVTTDSETKTNYITVLPATGRSMAIEEGFETLTLPSSDWFVYNPDGSAAWTVSSSAAATGSKSLRLLNSNNDAGDIDEFISGSIDLSNATDVELTFKYAFAKQTATDADYLRIYASNDCGESWSVRKNISSSTIATAPNTTSNYVPAEVDWKQITVTNISSSYWTSNFRFKFQFVSGGGNNIYIDDINIYDPNTASIKENEDVNLFKVFPNPTKDIAKVSFDLVGNGNVKIVLTDMIGQQVQVVEQSYLNAGSHQFEINTNDLSNGIYFVNLSVDQKTITQKLIVE